MKQLESHTWVCDNGGAELAHSVFMRAAVSMSQTETSLFPWTDEITEDWTEGLTTSRLTQAPEQIPANQLSSQRVADQHIAKRGPF